ncbi:MAG: hypothetical protein KF681_16985 [Bdellovibrionaceae bacterium]|nr:hypothetical protein [Pseudobdellovibrionaceae bacterium]
MATMRLLTMILGFSAITLAAQAVMPVPASPPKKASKPMERPRLIEGAKIQIQSYDPASDTFTVQIIREPGVGPNIATPEAMVTAIGLSMKPETFRRKASEYIGAEFALVKPMPLLFMREVELRKNKRR